MALSNYTRSKVFISYSHEDRIYLERLRVHLKPLEREYEIEIWDDRKIKAGDKWRDEIRQGIETAKVAVLIVSADFLASDFIAENELPPLLTAAEREGATILPLIVSPSRFEKTESLSGFQTVNEPSMPLVKLERAQQEEILVKLSEDIENSLKLVPKLKTRMQQEEQIRDEASIGIREMHLSYSHEVQQYVEKLSKGVAEWNRWRRYNPGIKPDLTGVNLSSRSLIGIDLSRSILNNTNFSGANLSKSNLSKSELKNSILIETDLSEAVMYGADLRDANLTKTNLSKADLRESCLKKAILRQADLLETNFRRADLSMADMQRASLIATNFQNANLRSCVVYGISAWNLILENANQSELIITLPDEISITVDDLEVAQFMYMFVHNNKIRDVFNAITSKNVLILGSFSEKRRTILKKIENELRKRNYIPILFDFDKPASRDFTDTLYTLASLSRFIIADISSPKSIPHELSMIVPSVVVPVLPLLEQGEQPFAMFQNLLHKYSWVLRPLAYQDIESLIKVFDRAIIDVVEQKIEQIDRLKSGDSQNKEYY